MSACNCIVIRELSKDFCSRYLIRSDGAKLVFLIRWCLWCVFVLHFSKYLAYYWHAALIKGLKIAAISGCRVVVVHHWEDQHCRCVCTLKNRAFHARSIFLYFCIYFLKARMLKETVIKSLLCET